MGQQEGVQAMTYTLPDMSQTITAISVVDDYIAAHAVLDADESEIIRNTKDGYPEGQTPRELTLAERVAALCRYASDYARWFKDAEARAKELEKELTCIYATSESVALQEATATAANFMEMHSRAAQERDDARLALSAAAGSELLDAAREAVEAINNLTTSIEAVTDTAGEDNRAQWWCNQIKETRAAASKLTALVGTGKEPPP